MKKVLGVILGGLLLLPVVSNAADAQKAADNKKPVNSWTCEDFLAVDESFQPTAVGFAEALNNKDKPEDAVLDVQGIATVTPAIVHEGPHFAGPKGFQGQLEGLPKVHASTSPSRPASSGCTTAAGSLASPS